MKNKFCGIMQTALRPEESGHRLFFHALLVWSSSASKFLSVRTFIRVILGRCFVSVSHPGKRAHSDNTVKKKSLEYNRVCARLTVASLSA